jgi:hypothetical protein
VLPASCRPCGKPVAEAALGLALDTNQIEKWSAANENTLRRSVGTFGLFISGKGKRGLLGWMSAMFPALPITQRIANCRM